MKNAKTNGVYTSKDRRAFNILAYAFIILIAVLCVLPFWLVIVGSFTSEAEIYSQGYSLIPLDLHFSRGRVKMTLALAKGKREFEKRADESKKQWERDRQRLMKTRTRG